MSDLGRRQQRRCNALTSIRIERTNQDEKWGIDNDDGHSYQTMSVILSAEVGELNEEILNAKQWLMGASDEYRRVGARARLARMRREAVQVAAVACAIIEKIDRDLEHENDPDTTSLEAR